MFVRTKSLVSSLTGAALATVLSLGLPVAPALAGSVSIAVQPGGEAVTSLTITAAAGGGSATLTTRDGSVGDRDPRPGFIKIEPGIPQGEIAVVTIKAVGPAASAPAPAASAASAATSSRMMFGEAGLASFEPVDLPRLMSTDASHILLSVIDVTTYLASAAPPLTSGDLLQVVDGQVVGIDGLTLYDASALYGSVDSFFDIFVELSLVDLNLLPLWQGEVWVDSMIGFRQLVPEPGVLALAAVAGLGLVLQRRQRRRSRPG